MALARELTDPGPCARAWSAQGADERIALASVLQELTVAALELGVPTGSPDAFLDRVAERLGCYAVALLEVCDGSVCLLGASGVGTASRALAVPPETAADLAAGRAVRLPYPELDASDLAVEHFPMSVPPPTSFHLLLYFQGRPQLPSQSRKMLDRLASLLGTVLRHRELLARSIDNERALDEQKTLLDCIAETSMVGIVVIGHRGDVLIHNQRFVQMWGITAGPLRDVEQVIEASAANVIAPDAFRARMRDLIARRGAEECEEIALTDGRVIERRTAPVRSRAGVEYGLGVWDVDVTERKNALVERERLLDTERAARAEAERAIRARDEFLLVASHELRTPLTSMQLVVQSLRDAHHRGAPLEPTVVLGLLENVERQTRRLSRLVGELLDVSHVSAGELDLALEQFDLVAVCRDVIARFGGELARSGSSVFLDAPAPVVGRWDRSRIDQVVSNLLSNAVKYGGGRPIDVTVRGAAGLARLAVHDRGIGIAPEQIARVFERFERAVSSRHYGGLGLGLYIARHIVELHGGSIRAESAPGEGTTFTVLLPIETVKG